MCGLNAIASGEGLSFESGVDVSAGRQCTDSSGERELENRRNCGEVLLLLCIVGMRADPSQQRWNVCMKRTSGNSDGF